MQSVEESPPRSLKKPWNLRVAAHEKKSDTWKVESHRIPTPTLPNLGTRVKGARRSAEKGFNRIQPSDWVYDIPSSGPRTSNAPDRPPVPFLNLVLAGGVPVKESNRGKNGTECPVFPHGHRGPCDKPRLFSLPFEAFRFNPGRCRVRWRSQGTAVSRPQKGCVLGLIPFPFF